MRLDALVMEIARASATFLVCILREKTIAVCTPPLLYSAHTARKQKPPLCSSLSLPLKVWPRSALRVALRDEEEPSEEPFESKFSAHTLR